MTDSDIECLSSEAHPSLITEIHISMVLKKVVEEVSFCSCKLALVFNLPCFILLIVYLFTCFVEY